MRLAISVFPTPVGPIISMFFGMTSSRRSSSSIILLNRFRMAMATFLFASPWPMMSSSSLDVISLGVKFCFNINAPLIDRFYYYIIVCEHTDFTCDKQAVIGDLFCRELTAVPFQSTSCTERIVAAAADGEYAVVRFDHFACARDEEQCLPSAAAA